MSDLIVNVCRRWRDLTRIAGTGYRLPDVESASGRRAAGVSHAAAIGARQLVILAEFLAFRKTNRSALTDGSQVRHSPEALDQRRPDGGFLL
ncbi:MAG: hypothetical protein MZV70_71260 [Desulfobacterales bacterium]|nr:hypothetical protein [Desulfobacterales bacterium]